MASETVVRVLARRHVTGTQRPFPAVLDGSCGGISSRHWAAVRQRSRRPVWSSHLALVCHPDEVTKLINPAAGPARRTYDTGPAARVRPARSG